MAAIKLNDAPDQLDQAHVNNQSSVMGHTSQEYGRVLLDSRHVDMPMPRLMEEGRKKHRRGGNSALYWALAIKGSFLAMAYQGIAVMSGLALVMGKIALLLSAILGLKKLVSGGQETTTFEIIKQPKHSEQHTYSTSYEDETHHRSSNWGDTAFT
ncbi:hypothetical protein NQ318_017225 [Aromia moschata]|uniref:Uncharacterized protein n=1 Tax=Aromia moschata TaxID=1265417 RepID=A0AAV8YM48_9CUCU|nr:hypothetical protein NQ318_017225 [Aromia moschata]